jgi:hypothetical protein
MDLLVFRITGQSCAQTRPDFPGALLSLALAEQRAWKSASAATAAACLSTAMAGCGISQPIY